MKFKNKPRIITAEQFFPHEKVWPHGVHCVGNTYVVFNKLHSSYIELKPGDWVRQDDPNDRYPIDKKYMEDNYEEVI